MVASQQPHPRKGIDWYLKLCHACCLISSVLLVHLYINLWLPFDAEYPLELWLVPGLVDLVLIETKAKYFKNLFWLITLLIDLIFLHNQAYGRNHTNEDTKTNEGECECKQQAFISTFVNESCYVRFVLFCFFLRNVFPFFCFNLGLISWLIKNSFFH